MVADNNRYMSLINEMIEQRQSEPLEEKIANTRDRNIRVAGIIRDYLAKKYHAEVIVTGGLSVEYYTDGGYTTQDIDMITQSQRELEIILTDLGFMRDGKYWVHDPLEIVIEVVASVPFDGVYKPTLKAATKDGFSVNFVDINDILMDRVRGLAHWQYKDYGEQLLAMIDSHLQKLDMEYLKKNLEGKEEYELLLYHIRLLQNDNLPEAQAYRVKRYLEQKGIPYSELREGDESEYLYLAFPLQENAKTHFGSYFGLLLLPHIDILLYNDDEEEFESKEDADVATTLIKYSARYGEPFSSILEALEKEVVE
ncbi:hypothetical protein B0533_04650 [Sedimentibacter sp. SX930]|nr:hypothetical protein B0533_04650 [Sedimentibacter sp. SX930]